MEWLKELLKAQGLEDEVINKIVESYKTESAKFVIPKEKFNEVNEAKKQLEKDIVDRDKQLNDLKEKSTKDSDLQAEITRLQEENKKNKESYDNDIYTTKLNNEIEKTLLAAKAKDLNIAKAAFNLEDVKLDDSGQLSGFSEQLEKIQESHKYLFGIDETPSGTGGSMGNKEKSGGSEDAFLKGFNA